MYRYNTVVNFIRSRIASGTLQPGDRLPSVRELSRQLGYSIITVHHAYGLLESDGTITARPRSGFFIRPERERLSDFNEPAATDIKNGIGPVLLTSLNYEMMSLWHQRELEAFGAIHPSRELFELDELDRLLRQVLRKRSRRTVQRDPLQGNVSLRETIARRLARRGIVVSAADVTISRSGTHGLSLSLDAVTRRGGTVMIETPCYPPILALLQRRGLMALEIYSHPRNGLDPDQFSYLLDHHEVSACILSPTNHFPTGVSYSKDALARIASKAQARAVPIIEVDLFGELDYANETSCSLKLYDNAENIILSGSLLNILGPDYGIGWTVTRRWSEALTEQKFMTDPTAGEGLIQEAIAQYMQGRSVDRNIRGLREKLADRMARGMELISNNFPPSCAISVPNGGFMCWIRCPQSFDALGSLRTAADLGTSFAAGPLLSPTNGFSNFLGLNFSFPWTLANVEKLKALAQLLSAEKTK